jgi:hypothetical protein
MNLEKLEYLKLGNSVKCGQHEKTYFESKDFDMTVYKEMFVKIICRRSKRSVWTSLMNAISWDFELAEKAPITASPGTVIRKKLPQEINI